MHRTIARFGILVAAIGLAQAADKLREQLVGYDKFEVAEFRNKVGENLENQVVADLQTRILQAINQSKLITASTNPELRFPRKDPSDDTKLAWQGTAEDADGRTLVLFSELITFNKGNVAGLAGSVSSKGNTERTQAVDEVKAL